MQKLPEMLIRSGLALASLSAASAFAHHSYTKFDMAKSITLEGTVKEFQWTNPHIWIQLLVKEPGTDKEVEWSIESDSPNMLKRRGWTRKSLQPGDKATAVVHPSKINTNGNSAALESLSVNGQVIGGAAPRQPAGAAP